MNERLDLLSGAEQQAYRLLLRMAGAGADDLAAQAGIDTGEATALLESLRDKGLATGGPPFDALPPDVALGETPALTRGVRYRAIYERELLEKPGELESILDAIGLGEQSRTLPTLPVRLAIADRALAICPPVPDAVRGLGEPTAAVIRPSELLDALIALFESYWERATPLLPDGAAEE
ncbi:MAG TPA: TrmB family transcriptional regulator, partial [Actinoplanes sp.]